jgi:hypothetical protein
MASGERKRGITITLARSLFSISHLNIIENIAESLYNMPGDILFYMRHDIVSAVHGATPHELLCSHKKTARIF